MPGAGLRIHPNTDDPTLHKVTPTGAWQMMVEHFGFGIDDLRGFMLNGLDGAFLPDETRRRWRGEWGAEFDALRARLVSMADGEDRR
jgi:adenine deaminase